MSERLKSAFTTFALYVGKLVIAFVAWHTVAQWMGLSDQVRDFFAGAFAVFAMPKRTPTPESNPTGAPREETD